MTIARELDIILAHGPELSAGGLDYYKLGLWAAGRPYSRILSLDPALPLTELERRLRAFLHGDQAHTVLLAALDPQRRARHILRLLTETLQVNPELVAVVDLQEALGSPDPKACSLKAHHLIGVNASMVTRAQPITTQELPVTARVLVWGDSFAALKAAVDLADLGYPVMLAHPGPTLSPLLPGAAPAQPPGAELHELISRAQSHPGIQLLPQTHLVEVQDSAGNFRVRLKTPEAVRDEPVGAIILAPELCLSPGEAGAGAASHPLILTQSRLEDLLAGPASAQTLLDPEAPRLRVAFLGGDSHPLALARTLSAARALLARITARSFFLSGTPRWGPRRWRPPWRKLRLAGSSSLSCLSCRPGPSSMTALTSPFLIR